MKHGPLHKICDNTGFRYGFIRKDTSQGKPVFSNVLCSGQVKSTLRFFGDSSDCSLLRTFLIFH